MQKSENSLCDEDRFDSFYRVHARLLRNFIYYKFGDEQQADDVVQEAFTRLWQNCAKVTAETAKSYLYKIATNLSTSLKRSESIRLKYEERVIRDEKSSQTPEFLILEKEFMEKLSRAIESLPERQREVFLMNRVEKLTYREIAELSGVSVKAIEKLMHKALVKLRQQIENI